MGKPKNFHGKVGSNVKISPEEKVQILEMKDAGKTVAQISYYIKRDPSAVYSFLRKMHPTVRLATAKLRAGAEALADRILRRASVDQAIDVLSRTNIGVLDPIKQGNSGPTFQFSVNQGSLGAVPDAARILPAPPVVSQQVIEATPEVPEKYLAPAKKRKPKTAAQIKARKAYNRADKVGKASDGVSRTALKSSGKHSGIHLRYEHESGATDD